MIDDPNKPSQNDGDFEDDFGLEDLDAEALDDDIWDDSLGDDDISATTHDDAAAAAVEFLEADERPSRKTFMQKYFNLIVISVAVLGGGFFFIHQFGATPSKSSPTAEALTPDTQSQPQSAAPEALPTTAQNLPEALPNEPAAVVASTSLPPPQTPLDAPSPLTPMPTGTMDTALTPSPSSPPAQQTPDTPKDAGQNNLAYLDLSTPDAASPPTQAPAQQASVPAATEAPLVPSPTPSVQPETPPQAAQAPAAEVQPVQAAELPVPPPVVPTPTTTAAPVDTEAATKAQAKIDELTSKIADLESKLSTVDKKSGEDTQAQEIASKKMLEEVSALNDRLQDKDKEIASLKADLDKAKLAAEKQSAVSTAPTPTVIEETPAAEKIAKPAPTPTTAKKASRKKHVKTETQASSSTHRGSTTLSTPSANTNWQIRSAQPGRALIVKSGSQDLQSVEVGDSVAGLGKITAIEQQNGTWRIVGTRGSITR